MHSATAHSQPIQTPGWHFENDCVRTNRTAKVCAQIHFAHAEDPDALIMVIEAGLNDSDDSVIASLHHMRQILKSQGVRTSCLDLGVLKRDAHGRAAKALKVVLEAECGDDGLHGRQAGQLRQVEAAVKFNNIVQPRAVC